MVIPAKRPYRDQSQYDNAVDEMRNGLQRFHLLAWAIGDEEDFDQSQCHPVTEAFIGNMERWLVSMGKKTFPSRWLTGLTCCYSSKKQ